MNGKLIVIEGIDGAGTETQSKMLLAHCKKEGVPAARLEYPDYKGAFGGIIKDFLSKGKDLPVEMQFLFYAADIAKDREKIASMLAEGKAVICDRYFTSTIAYQGVRGFYVKKSLRFAEDFGIRKPDVVILLQITPQESLKRKRGENGKLDRNEEDGAFLEKVNRAYFELASDNVFGRWFVIDGERPKELVFEDVLSVLSKV